MTTRVLLADDHDVVRAGLRAVLEKQAGVVIVGEAPDGRSAVELAAKLRPDLVLMDVSMPHLNGVEAARQILADMPGVKIIAISMHADRRFVSELLKAGATGYMLKNTITGELPAALHEVAHGRVYLSPTITGIVVEDYVRLVPEGSRGAFATLSVREREVLQLLAEGGTSKEIASALHISPKTVETHRAQIMDKLGIRTVAELTKIAIREGLTSLE